MTQSLTSVTTMSKVIDMSRHAHWEVRFWSRVMFLPGDMCWQWTGARSITPEGDSYGSFILNNKKVRPHRVAYELLIGSADGLKFDHRCRNKMCIRPAHLRPATHKQNGENRGVNCNNTSGYRGVSWNVKHQRWIAALRHNGIHVHVGCFDTAEDANQAVVAKRNELYTYNELDRISA